MLNPCPTIVKILVATLTSVAASNVVSTGADLKLLVISPSELTSVGSGRSVGSFIIVVTTSNFPPTKF